MKKHEIGTQKKTMDLNFCMSKLEGSSPFTRATLHRARADIEKLGAYAQHKFVDKKIFCIYINNYKSIVSNFMMLM